MRTHRSSGPSTPPGSFTTCEVNAPGTPLPSAIDHSSIANTSSPSTTDSKSCFPIGYFNDLATVPGSVALGAPMVGVSSMYQSRGL